MYYYVIVAGLLLGLLRVFGVTHIAFQAEAHLFMGGLFVAACYKRATWMWVLFGGLTVLETVCFIVSKLSE